MRLRYVHIRNYPPLEDVALSFRKPVLPERECAIRFVVGVNGSGKTHLLQALAESFLALARKKRPHFPVTLAWELGENERRRTLIFQNPSHRANPTWWQGEEIFSDDANEDLWAQLLSEIRTGKEGWESLIRDGNFPGTGVGLPTTVLTYTTGCLDSWKWLFRHEPPAADLDVVSQSEDYDTRNERPVRWTRQHELDYQATQASDEGRTELARLQKLADESTAREHDQNICMLVDPLLLKFALLAVSLRQAMEDFRQYPTDGAIKVFKEQIRNNSEEQQGLRRLLSQVGWLWPVSVVLQVDFKPDSWSQSETRQNRELLQALYLIANEVVREPAPSTKRQLFFDLWERSALDDTSAPAKSGVYAFLGTGFVNGYIGEALLQFLGGSEISPFENFKVLLGLHRNGLLTDIQIAVRKTDVDDILLFDELSDGEQMFLGRIALLHLLEGESDALLLLDEPEVHFNDKWKREIVDIIDEVLKDRPNDVLIATHSSITLTDVFNDEITLFHKREGRSVPIDIHSTTFGADPSEVMIRLFGVPDSMGKRALEWLDSQLDRTWTATQVDELEKLVERVGPGFHRSELRGILKRLKSDAAQD